MTFLNPLVLLGLVAAAIPLVIHLFNFRRPRRVDFSTLAFVRELERATMQRVRLRQWLLLLLRTLAIACLVLSFARPSLTGGLAGVVGGHAPASIALVVDNSRSMALRDAGGAYLAQARAAAAGVVQAMQAGDEVFVLTTAGPVEADPAPYGTAAGALEALERIDVASGARPMGEVLARAHALLAERPRLNREVFVLADLQASTWGDTTAGLDGEAPLRLVPVGERRYANVAVEDVEVVSRIIEPGQPVEVEAVVVNHGEEGLDDYGLSLYLDDVRVAQASAALPPGVPTRVRLTATPGRRGLLAGRVEAEEDAFPADDVRHFVLHAPAQRRVLVVVGDGADAGYVTLALAARPQGAQGAFDVDQIPAVRLPATALGAYDAVLLVAPRALSSGEVEALAGYVEGGGGLMLFPAAGARSADYNALFSALGGGAFSGFTGELGAGRAALAFDDADLDHPVLSGLFGRAGQARALERPDVYFAANYAPRGAAEQTLVRLSNGSPFLQEIRRGEGAALLMAVAPDTRWSDLPVRGLWVPLLHRSVLYLAAGVAHGADDVTAGAPAELRLAAAAGADEALRVVGPEGEEYVPEQRTLFGGVVLSLPAFETPGLYDVEAAGRIVQRFAVNEPPSESDLATLSASEARERLEAAGARRVEVMALGGLDPAALAQRLREERTGIELWNVFLGLALAFLAAEMLVARRWKPETAAA